MQFRMIRTGFEPFECKFESFEMDFNYSNANSTKLNVIRNIWVHHRTIRKRFNYSKPSLNHSNENWSIRMEIWTIQKGF